MAKATEQPQLPVMEAVVVRAKANGQGSLTATHASVAGTAKDARCSGDQGP